MDDKEYIRYLENVIEEYREIVSKYKIVFDELNSKIKETLTPHL